MRVPAYPHHYQHLILPVFMIIATQVDVKWCLIMVLFCISLMANDVEHLFMLTFVCVCIYIFVCVCIYYFGHMFFPQDSEISYNKKH